MSEGGGDDVRCSRSLPWELCRLLWLLCGNVQMNEWIEIEKGIASIYEAKDAVNI